MLLLLVVVVLEDLVVVELLEVAADLEIFHLYRHHKEILEEIHWELFVQAVVVEALVQWEDLLSLLLLLLPVVD
jgi:hypothetical protein